MVAAVTRTVSLPVIVGGGICSPEKAANLVKAGASFVVTGNVLEREDGDAELMTAFAQAIHKA